MRRLMMGAALALFVLPMAETARAGELFSYEQENGTLAFTDDLKQVPKKYRAEVKKSEAKVLADYERLSVSDVSYPTPEMLAAREAAWLDHEVGAALGVTDLRSVAGADADAAAVGSGPGTGVVFVEVGPGITVPVTAAAGEPIRVQHNVYRWEAGRYTPFTIIRQGDKVLAEIARP